MKDRNCIKCEKFFECPGKDTKAPCLHFKERKQKNDYKFKTERRAL